MEREMGWDEMRGRRGKRETEWEKKSRRTLRARRHKRRLEGQRMMADETAERF